MAPVNTPHPNVRRKAFVVIHFLSTECLVAGRNDGSTIASNGAGARSATDELRRQTGSSTRRDESKTLAARERSSGGAKREEFAPRSRISHILVTSSRYFVNRDRRGASVGRSISARLAGRRCRRAAAESIASCRRRQPARGAGIRQRLRADGRLRPGHDATPRHNPGGRRFTGRDGTARQIVQTLRIPLAKVQEVTSDLADGTQALKRNMPRDEVPALRSGQLSR